MNIYSSYRKLNDYKGASCGQHSALSTQHSALSTQHSALKTFFCRLITSALLYGALLSNAAAVQMSCLLGLDPHWNELTPAVACEKFYATMPPVFVHRTVASPPYPQYERYFIFNCIAGLNQSIIDQVLVDMLEDLIPGEYSKLSGQCECPTGIAYSNLSGTEAGCKTTDKTHFLTLTPAPNLKDPRPKGTEGKDPKSSTYELIAKVMEGNTPKAGVAVTFAVEVEPNTGGHDHHDASRPKGLVNGALTASGKTEANGEIKVTFQASEFAGTHVVAAACDSCTNKSVTKNVDVKVPGLSPLGHDMGPPQFIYWGSTPKHFSNHWFTIPAKISLAKLVEALVSFKWFPIGINDGSLKWGGSFDVPGHWAVGTNHDEHRIGEEVDISFVMGTNAKKITRSYYELCRDKKIDVP